MGFNLGSTKTRQVWDGRMRKFFFESPLVRLRDEVVWINAAGGIQRSDRRYDDVYVDGEDLTAPDPEDPTKPLRPDITLPYRVHRDLPLLRRGERGLRERGRLPPSSISRCEAERRS